MHPDPTPNPAENALHGLRAHVASGATLPIPARLAALRRLDAALATHEAAIVRALHDDLGKPGFESYSSEIIPIREEIRHALAHLPRWAKPSPIPTRWYHWPARASVTAEPRGAVLVLSPWNYPLQLALIPVVSAIAAGNAVLLKPSETTPATAAILAAIAATAFDPAHLAVLQGGPGLAKSLTAQPWDHIFFTGSTPVGRAVAQAAAANLVPCTLELGGCNPCIVDPTADIAIAARRIVWGKFLNAGQTCLAPNHLLVHESRIEALMQALQTTLQAFYGPGGKALQRVVDRRHFDRLSALLPQGRIAHGGETDAATLHIAPTLLRDVPPEASCLHEEIFGPILPILSWRDEDHLWQTLDPAATPLAIYVHSRDPSLIGQVAARTRSGALVINDHIVQATVPDLPFGGLGASGLGRAHGRAGFEAFSNLRSRYHKSARIDLPLRYPPYDGKLAWVKRTIG